MSTAIDTTAVQATLATQSLQAANGTTPRSKDLDKAAKQFESMFITQMLSNMTAGMEVDEAFGGGSGEQMFRGMLNEQYGNAMAKTGMTGIAPAVKAELLKLQEGVK